VASEKSTGAVLAELSLLLESLEPSETREAALALVAELASRKCYGLSMLPLSCWPLRDLQDLRESILRGLRPERLSSLGAGWPVALDWLDAVDTELASRGKLPTLERACGVKR